MAKFLIKIQTNKNLGLKSIKSKIQNPKYKNQPR